MSFSTHLLLAGFNMAVHHLCLLLLLIGFTGHTVTGKSALKEDLAWYYKALHWLFIMMQVATMELRLPAQLRVDVRQGMCSVLETPTPLCCKGRTFAGHTIMNLRQAH